MPVIVVHGLSDASVNQGDLNALLGWDLPQAATSVQAMGITPDLVSVFAPMEVAFNGSSDVVVFVEGLFMREERTEEVLQAFAEAIRDCVVHFVQRCVPDRSKIEVITRSHREPDAYASWKRPS